MLLLQLNFNCLFWGNGYNLIREVYRVTFIYGIYSYLTESYIYVSKFILSDFEYSIPVSSAYLKMLIEVNILHGLSAVADNEPHS